MLTHAIVAPAHQMFIPEIGTEALKEVEQTVNGFLKLAVKIHAENPDALIIVSPKAPILHHRISIANGQFLMRAFESNAHQGDVVEISFGIAGGVLQEVEKKAMEYKIQVDPYTQPGNVAAIDDGSLSLLYYLQKVQCFPEVLLCGVSDLSEEKHADFGRALGEVANQDEKKVMVVVLGTLELMNESIGGAMLNAMTSDDFFGYRREIQEFDALGAGQEFYYPLAVLRGCMETAWGEVPAFHHLGTNNYHGKGFVTGYFEK